MYITKYLLPGIAIRVNTQDRRFCYVRLGYMAQEINLLRNHYHPYSAFISNNYFFLAMVFLPVSCYFSINSSRE